MDGDWQHLPEELLGVAEPIKRGEADIVIGSRYIEHSSDVPAPRVFGHWWFTTITNLLSGTTVTDSQSGYRAFSNKAINTLKFSSNSFSVESEMQFLARNLNLRVSEVPITIRYYTKPKRFVLSHGMIVLNGILRLVAQHRPLLFFGVPGLISTFVGLLLALHVVNLYDSTKQLAIGTALIVMMMIIVGTFLFFTSIILYSMRLLLDEVLLGTRRSMSINTVNVTQFKEL
jgi:glycosyltransferase involved in cell wall biosynthesis